MAKAARVISILAVGVCFCSLPAFVPGPAHPARSMAPAAAGALSMLGAAPAFADKIDDGQEAVRRLLPLPEGDRLDRGLREEHPGSGSPADGKGHQQDH